MTKENFTYCSYCNGRKEVKREDGKVLICIACNGTGKRYKDYGVYNQL